MQQAIERKLIVFFLIPLPVSVGAKLSASGPTLQEGQLLSAIQAAHVTYIVPSSLMLKGALTSFHAVKHL